jgi:hypothetical protein
MTIFAKNEAGSENAVKQPISQKANEVWKLKECSGITDPGNVQNQMRKTT